MKEVGYEHLNGDAMKNGMESIYNFEPMGLGVGYTWTPSDHQGLQGVRWYRWTRGGLLTPISEWYVPASLPEEQRTDEWWLKE